MHTVTTTGRRHRLATALLCALLLPGAAFAQSAKERELEARIAQLEAQVQALIGAQQQQQATITQTQSALDQVKVAQAAPADGKPKIHLADLSAGIRTGAQLRRFTRSMRW